MKRDKIKITKTVIKMIKESWSLVYEHNKWYLGVNIGLTVILGSLPATQIIVLQSIINSLQSGADSFTEIFQLIVLYIGINILSFCVQEVYGYYNNTFTLRFNKFVNLKMLNKATQLQLKDFENTEIYNIIKRAQNQGAASVLNYLTSVFDIIKQIIIIGSTIIILLHFQWWIIVFVLIAPVIKYIYTVGFDRKWYEIRIERTDKERRAWYISFLLMTGNAFKEIKLLSLKEYFVSKYNEIQSQIINEDIRLHKKITIVYIILGIFDYCITGGAFVYTVYQGYIKTIMIGDVTAYTECIYDIKTSIENIFLQMSQIIQQSLYVELLFEFFNIEVQKDNSGIDIDEIYKVELRNVSYKYDNNYVLKDISLVIERGTTIALVGENGSGKTMLTKLILGFYDDYEGEILINDIDLRKVNKTSYTNKIGCVFQDYVKYETTLRENVGFGQIDKIHDNIKIWNAIKSVDLKEGVYKDCGLETIMGNWFGNKQISIGEWQRIAIARALIRDADLYILDESDSSIDIIKQKELIDIYTDVLKQKLGIIISHKINHVHLLANTIYVLEDGKIIEKGTHSELIKNDKLYKKFYMECEKMYELNFN
ncbi:ABC transporter ATP-binding protein [Anaerophilus nitritogenes]|uniref:ABC transporter ATP-binding protein n=1 Tax=Anaerophilus nitritogenes TaxID=2498136 RepID=UPI00101E19F3|nr:ABC transporter ATP-binding protein [Anaerophilus nitritogenes]